MIIGYIYSQKCNENAKKNFAGNSSFWQEKIDKVINRYLKFDAV